MILRNNYLLVKAYLKDLMEVYQLSSNSLSRYRFYLRHLLLWAGETPFCQVTTLRPTFPGYVNHLPGRQDDAPLAPVSQKKIIESGKRFFTWAKQNHSKEFEKVSPTWLASLRPPRTRDIRQENEFVTLDEVLSLISVQNEEGNLALLRDKAAAALLFLSGARASAFTTLPISAVDLPNRSLYQWPELRVETKNSKRATTFLLPIPELFPIVQVWDDIVRRELPSTAPWYAPVKIHWGSQTLDPVTPGKNRNQALDKRLHRLFAMAGLPYHSAHKFRHGHAVYGLQHAQTMADYKAVSMNLMHEDIKITDEIYAPILTSEMKDRISRLNSVSNRPVDEELANTFAHLSNSELAKIMLAAAKRLSS